MDNSNLLITGGSGFLGTHVITLLLKKGFRHITVVDLIKPKVSGVTYIQGNFANETIMKPLLKKSDTLFHFAAVIGVDRCRNNPDLVKKINLDDTRSLINLSVKYGIKKIIFSSSSEVYGNSKDTPFREDGKLEPVSVYGETKVEIEKYLQKIQKTSKIRVGIVRLFNVYGPGQKKDFVISIFVNAALHNKSIRIFGNGRQTRTFTYVGDVADGILKMYQYSKTAYEIVNLGSQQEYSISEVAQMVLDCFPESKSRIIYTRYQKDAINGTRYEIDKRVPSIEKAKLLLRFEAKTTLHEGLKKIATSLKQTKSL